MPRSMPTGGVTATPHHDPPQLDRRPPPRQNPHQGPHQSPRCPPVLAAGPLSGRGLPIPAQFLFISVFQYL